ncbi:MAG: CBS domain-containing protein, partial [Gemmatimonadota bacterium]
MSGEQERRPVYGFYYASAIRRVTQRPSRGGYSSGQESGRGFGGRGSEQSGFQAGSGRGGFSEGSFGQGGGYGDQGAYGSQYIRGTGGQSGSQLGYGRGGRAMGSTSEFDRYGATGYEGRESESGGGGGSWQENRERYESGLGQSRSQDRDFRVGSSSDQGWQGGRSQATRGGYGSQASRGGQEWRGGEGRFDRESRYGSGAEGGRSLGVERNREGADQRGGQLGVDTERGRTRWQREALTAREIMTRDVKAVTKQSTLKNVAQIMKDENCGIVPIVDESHKLLGVVTDRDLVIRSLAEDKSPVELKVEDVMTEDVEAVTGDEELREIIELMGEKQIRRVPVVDREDRLIGIIAMADIA